MEYGDTGMITVATFADGAVEGPPSVIPVPPNYDTAMPFDFVNYTGEADTPDDETDPAR